MLRVAGEQVNGCVGEGVLGARVGGRVVGLGEMVGLAVEAKWLGRRCSLHSTVDHLGTDIE